MAVLCMVSAFAQSKREWLLYGDEAFKKGDYSSAAGFYLKVLDEGTLDLESTVYPYEVIAYIKPDKPAKSKDNTAAADTTSDSTAVVPTPTDSLPQTPANPSAEDSEDSDPANSLVYGKYQYVVHQIADCFRLSYQYKKAEEWYGKAVQNESNRHPFSRYYYALTLMNNEKYDEAQAQLEKFIENYNGPDTKVKDLATKKMFSIAFAKDPASTHKDSKVSLLDTTINSGSSSFAANFYNDEGVILFAGGRKENVILDERTQNPLYLSDLFLAEKEGEKWNAPKNMRRPVNTEANEGAGVISVDRTHFYFTRCEGPNGNECSIYLSRFLNGKWLQPMKLNDNVNMEGFSSKHPALSTEEDILYFSSDRPGSIGGMDLWFCKIDDFGNAGEAHNLGYSVNTKENEVTPYFHHINNTLYFSSDGHTGLGGLDIFKAYGKDSTWSRPRNLGRPFNSGKDDLYYLVDRFEGKTGFLTSDRDSCANCSSGSDLYCYRIYELETEPLRLTIKGTVYDQKTQEPMQNTLVQLTDVKEDVPPVFVITDENGFYSTNLIEEVQYFMKAQKVKYFADAFSLNTEGAKESKDYTHDFFLEPIPSEPIAIPGIEYDYNKATLRPESMKILDDLYDFLQLNDNIVIEIGSHTDERGSADYNLDLSNRRAESVVNYLLEKGIPQARLEWKGYGETMPLVPNAKTEDDHQRNRRTAFKVTDQYYKE
ncbi:MAG: OmpA family protein [Flavobacteriales bacterium]|nr:OmpA family protein [Flavobacteriales bacterium]